MDRVEHAPYGGYTNILSRGENVYELTIPSILLGVSRHNVLTIPSLS